MSTDNNFYFQQWYHNKKVLVTGGCGFIGSHIVDSLVAAGAEVVILDDLSTGRLENIALVRDKVTFIQGSLCNQADCAKAVKGVACIFHMAARTSVPESNQNPDMYYETNVQGMEKLLNAAHEAGAMRIVFASSAAVYGTKEGICSEEMLCEPISVYGKNKADGERLCREYNQKYNMDTVALRYFNVFGPRQDGCSEFSGVVGRFRYLLAQKEPITIYGDGLQQRDFVPVETVVLANLLCGAGIHLHTPYRVFNIGTGKGTTIRSLVESLIAEYDVNTNVTYAPARSGDIKESIAAICRFTELLAVAEKTGYLSGHMHGFQKAFLQEEFVIS